MMRSFLNYMSNHWLLLKILKYLRHQVIICHPNKKRQNSSTLADYYVTITIGKRMAYSFDNMKTEQKIIFINILDVIYFEMNQRFNTNDVMYAT
jgi:hypothetical protein